MDLLHRLASHLGAKLDELEIRHQLARLDDRSLADIGLERADIKRLARAAARPVAPARPDGAGPGVAVLAGRVLRPRAA